MSTKVHFWTVTTTNGSFRNASASIGQLKRQSDIRADARRRNARPANLERGLECGRRILAVDPLRESVQREVMLLLALNGQRVEAIRMYKRLVALLKSELDIAPMPETERLHDDILSGKIFEKTRDLTALQLNRAQT